jgi:hypothetical protein
MFLRKLLYDINLELQYPYSHVFGLQSDSKLLSGFPEGLMNYPVLYIILIEFGVPMKLVRLIKMCLN